MKLCSQFESERPKYQNIALSLLEDFKAGGDALGRSQLRLAREFQVNRLTVRHALEWLERNHPATSQAARRKRSRNAAAPAKRTIQNVIGFPIFADSFAEQQAQPLLGHFRLAEAASHELHKSGFKLDVQWVGTSSNPNREKIRHLMEFWDAAIVEPMDSRGTLGPDHPFYPMAERLALVGAFQGMQNNCVYPDYYHASQIAITELLSSGARRILYTGSKNETVALRLLRLLGVEKSFDTASGVELLFAGGDAEMESAFSNVKNFFQGGGVCDAIFTGNAYATMGTLRALSDMKIRVPEDIQVIGLGRVLFSNYLVPRPTTISAGMHEIGKAAARTAMALVRHNGQPQPNTIVPMNLSLGETTRRDDSSREGGRESLPFPVPSSELQPT